MLGKQLDLIIIRCLPTQAILWFYFMILLTENYVNSSIRFQNTPFASVIPRFCSSFGKSNFHLVRFYCSSVDILPSVSTLWWDDQLKVYFKITSNYNLIQYTQFHIFTAPVLRVTCSFTQQERIRCSAILAMRSSLSKSNKQMIAMMKNAAPLVCKTKQTINNQTTKSPKYFWLLQEIPIKKSRKLVLPSLLPDQYKHTLCHKKTIKETPIIFKKVTLTI